MMSGLWYLVPFLAVSLIVAWGCYFIQSGFFLKAYCEGDSRINQMAITFDDGPHEKTSALLDILKRYDAKATFFCIGKNIPGRENVLGRMAAEGHIVGNHSYSHSPLIDFFPFNKLDEDVSKTDELLFQVLGKKNRIFRPPYGVTTPIVARLVKRKRYHVIGWNLRSYDTSIKDHDKLMRRINMRLKNGSVLLLHDSTPGIEIVLEKVLLQAAAQQLQVVSIEQLFHIKANDQT
jgi:peptidoglycan/xylan/chitin deacetylase (PgdA/CDA1 family)